MTKTRQTPLAAAIGALTLFALAMMLAPSRAVFAARDAQPAAQPQNAPSTTGTPNASATPSLKDALFVVSHVDLLPDALPMGKAALLQYVADSRKDAGAIRIELLEQPDRPNHFTIVSVWSNEKAFNAHLATAHTREFRAKIQSGLGSPFDERLHHLAQ